LEYELFQDSPLATKLYFGLTPPPKNKKVKGRKRQEEAKVLAKVVDEVEQAEESQSKDEKKEKDEQIEQLREKKESGKWKSFLGHMRLVSHLLIWLTAC